MHCKESNHSSIRIPAFTYLTDVLFGLSKSQTVVLVCITSYFLSWFVHQLVMLKINAEYNFTIFCLPVHTHTHTHQRP